VNCPGPNTGLVSGTGTGTANNNGTGNQTGSGTNNNTGTGNNPVPSGMVYVPGGSFQMGTVSGGYSDEQPVHTVTLTGFYMGKYEVTQAQYQAVMGTNPSQTYGVGDNYPVYYVSWYDALVFCNKLSMMEGLTPAYRINNSTDPAAWGNVPTSNATDAVWDAVTIDSGSTGYRLPTEAQWEYAAKGGNGSPGNYTYAGSNTVGDVAWYLGNSRSRTHEVGTKAANGLGIYDMSGNVMEWCWDWYGTYPSTAQTDPLGASSGSDRVGRGGDLNKFAGLVRSAIRYDERPNSRPSYIGFRLVRPAQ
jgi:formylglycine-generating enzyme required for sulfatase activity